MMRSKSINYSYKYYKSMLMPTEQSAYQSILDGVESFDSSIRVSYKVCDSMQKIVDYLRYDNPLLFHVNDFSYTATGNDVRIVPRYLMSRVDYEKMLGVIETKIAGIAEIIKSKYVSEQVAKLHEVVVRNITYKDGPNSHNILGPLNANAGVCDGISRFVKLICDHLKVECVVLHGTAKAQSTNLSGSHSWNAIKLNGEWHLYDFTFDNTMNLANPCKEIVRFDYYALRKPEMERDHFGADDSKINISSKKKDYFSSNGLVIKNRSELAALIMRNKSGDIAFKLADSNEFTAFGKEIQNAIDTVNEQGKGVRRYEYAFNDIQRVCYLHLM